MGKMLGRALLCAIAGTLGWIVTEPMLPKSTLSPEWSRAEFVMVWLTLMLMGLAAGFHQGWMKGGRRNILFGIALGAVFGTIGGIVGYQIGGGLSSAIFGPGWAVQGFPIIPRTITFACIGSFLGMGVGLTQFRSRIVVAGAFGGLIGGSFSGLVFDPIGQTVGHILAGGGESGFVGRAVMWPLIGFTVGMFTAWLEVATRQAWVRLVLGRNEGKEWPIDGVRTFIGRDERANVPLFGDMNVAPLHATITRQGVNYILSDAGSPIGTGYQGMQLLQPVALQPGDTFQIGSHQLQFLVKAGAAQRIREGRAHAVPVGYQGSPSAAQPPGQPVPLTPIQTSGALSSPIGAPVQQTNPTQAYAQSAAVAGFALVALDGPMTGQRIAVAGPIEAGREAPGINLGFDAQASRRHATLAPTAQGIHVKDLGSTNGTFLNGQKVPEGDAPVGSVIKIGSTSFRVEST